MWKCKNESSTDKDVIYIIEELNVNDDYKFNIKSDKLEELCIAYLPIF